MKNQKKRIISIIAFLLTAVIVFAAMPYGYMSINAVDTSKEAEKAAKDKIAALQSEQKELKSKLEAAKSNAAEQERQKEYLDSLVLSTQNEIDLSNSLIADYGKQIEEKNAEIAVLEEKIDEKYSVMLERLRFTYEEGNASYLEMIFDASSFTDFLMTIERVGSLLDFDRSLMSDLQNAMNQLEEDRHTLTETKAAQEETEKQLKVKKEQLDTQIAETEAYIEKLQSDEQAYLAEYEKAKKEEAQADAEITKILEQRRREEEKKKAQQNKITSTNNDAPTFNGSFIWPVSTSFKNISSQYGGRTLWGRYDFHLGIDIPASYGSSVFASAAGTVVIATYHYSYGYYVLIDHGGGLSTLYAHNSQLLVSAGQSVSQGQVIAKVGSTGSSSGNHCHFEVRVNGATTNPLNYVSP